MARPAQHEELVGPVRLYANKEVLDALNESNEVTFDLRTPYFVASQPERTLRR
jgi:hypothetical protein